MTKRILLTASTARAVQKQVALPFDTNKAVRLFDGQVRVEISDALDDKLKRLMRVDADGNSETYDDVIARLISRNRDH